MTSFRNSRRFAAIAVAGCALAMWTADIRAELPEWARNVDATSRFRDAFFRRVSMPGGPVDVRRAPADTRAALARLTPAPSDRTLFALRARVAEEQLDPVAAEADWKAYAAASADVGDGQLTLADFYHRRLQPQQEAGALAAAAQAADPPDDRLLPAPQRRSWRTFERMFTLIAAQQLPDTFAEAQHRAWIARHPLERQPYHRLFAFFLAHDRLADADTLIGTYQQAFADDAVFPVRARAQMALARGSTAEGLAVYEQSFQPLWDPELVQTYFELLARTRRVRGFLEQARADVVARPDDLTPVARLFHYYQRSGNVAAAEQALADFEARREGRPRTPGELFTLAKLYETTRNFNETVRYYSAVFTLPGASPADTERALAGVIEILFAAPEQPLRVGSGDLSFYRDIGTIDRYPGFLNGVLSLLFNSASPSDELDTEETASAAYFHRARAADLLTLFDTRYPASSRRPDLHASLVETYAASGETDAVIDRGRRYLTAFPAAPRRTTVALAMADALARKEQVDEEFAIYDQLLQELATQADRVPLGQTDAGSGRSAAGARSQTYARVLDRYVARLVTRERLADAAAVYRREIDRNPDDPGLYAATAQFLEQNDFTAEVEQVYRRALQQFPDGSWHHRLARWYLRRNQSAAFEQLTRDVVSAFDGTALSGYFAGVVSRGPAVNEELYLQLNLYAHERFPHHLAFVRNLLTAYATPRTRNDAAAEALLRRHWFEDEDLSARFFATLSRTGRLDGELAEVRRAATLGPVAAGPGPSASGSPPMPPTDWTALARDNPVAARFLAEAGIWQSDFESATPVLEALSREYPGDVELGQRTTSLHRSLSYADPAETDAASAAAERIHRYEPRSAAALTLLGEIHADRERYDRARPQWNRIPQIEPGKAEGYLEAATIFWDYYQFDDAVRLIEEGRRRLNTPALFAYQLGAIHEGMGQPQRAVAEYVQGSLAAGGDSPAQSRLLALSRRQTYRSIADSVTAASVAGDAPPPEAVSLRVAVLEAQDRRSDLEAFLMAILEGTSSADLMSEIGAHAARLGFDAVRTRVVTRQIEVAGDPIEKLQLRYALARLYESRGDLPLARQTLDALYAEHPRVLGIVRETVDSYWRLGARSEAIAVLTRAAADAYPALGRQLTFEAARKATDLGDYARAREILAPLLAGDAFNAEYLAATADTYARARDDAALRDFYRATLEKMRGAPLAADERTRRIAALRRGLIPALTRLNDHTGAVDQYIEIINRYPDDEALLREAGRYARQHGRTTQLVAYYTKTAGDSPRDYRWPMLLARLQTQFEDFPAAIAAYDKSIAIRPDRVDFYTARGLLAERLLRFEDAIGSYTKAYDLTYHDPQWMEKIAELRARLGQVDEAAAALRLALVEGRPERPELYFDVASRLEGWQMLDAAKEAADRGAAIANPARLLMSGSSYVSVHTRLRQHAATFDRLFQLRREALAAASEAMKKPIEDGLSNRLLQMAEIVDRDFTPEEKADFAQFLERKKADASPEDVEQLLVPLAERAGVLDLAVRWRVELMHANRASDDRDYVGPLVRVQTTRLRFAELGMQLERFAGLRGPEANVARRSAAEAYRRAGDRTGEFRMLSRMQFADLPSSDRYFELLLERDPQRLIALARTGSAVRRDAAASFVLAHGTADQALAAVRARGTGLPAIWTQAYTALVGLYVSRVDEPTSAAFHAVLGPRTVGGQLASAGSESQLAGDQWSYYGSRFGEYLSHSGQPSARDYLPAGIESTPARSDAYVMLADFYRDRGRLADALAEYDRAATMNPRKSDVHLRAAAILWRLNRRDEAAARWTQTMELLTPQARRGRADPAELVAAIDAVSTRGLAPSLREPIDRMVRAYLTTNGAYRADEVVASVFRAAGDPPGGADWLIDLARVAPNQNDLLSKMAEAAWLPDTLRDRFHARMVATNEEAVAREHGVAQRQAQGALHGAQVRRIRALVDVNEAARAEALVRTLPDDVRTSYSSELTSLETRIAAATGTLGAVLDRYDREVDLDVLLEAAVAIRKAGNVAAAQRVLEFVYTRQLESEEPVPTAFLGLAGLRLDQGNVPAAMELLRRLSLVTREPFEHLAACAEVLEGRQRHTEALEFRRASVQAVPWDAEAQIALARIELIAGATDAARGDAAGRAARIAESPRVRYGLRADAARAFASSGVALGRPPQTEIDLIRVPSSLTLEAADRPLFVEARVAAAERAADPAARPGLLRAAVAIAPERQDVRLPLFRAELAVGRPTQAIEAVGVLTNRSSTLEDLGLTDTVRTRFARDLGDAYRRADRLPEAVRYYTLALDGEPAASQAALQARIASLTAEIARRAANDERRPRIAETLDQPQLVRPRIPPRTSAAARPAAAPAPGAGR